MSLLVLCDQSVYDVIVIQTFIRHTLSTLEAEFSLRIIRINVRFLRNIWQDHCMHLEKKFAKFEAAQNEIVQWMEYAESELHDIIKPTISDRVAVADNSTHRIQVSHVHEQLLICCRKKSIFHFLPA